MPTTPKILTCALLLHTPPPGAGDAPHHDWLVEPAIPFAPPNAGRLWTARIGPAPSAWRKLKAFPVEVIAPHRREYLSFEGEISGGRGRVERVDEGNICALAWTEDLLDWEVSLRAFQGRLRMERKRNGSWMAQAV